MTKTIENKLGILLWAFVAAGAIAAIVAAEKDGLGLKWVDASVYTAILFAAVIFAFRTAWKSSMFWRRLAACFVLHILILMIALLTLSPSYQGLRGLPMTLAFLAEALVLGTVLSKGIRTSHKAVSSPDTHST
jgi:hypothetical protein